jgi:hypothetical protein
LTPARRLTTVSVRADLLIRLRARRGSRGIFR